MGKEKWTENMNEQLTEEAVWMVSKTCRCSGSADEHSHKILSCLIASVAWTVSTGMGKRHPYLLLRKGGWCTATTTFENIWQYLVKSKMFISFGRASPCVWISLKNCCFYALESRMIITLIFIMVKLEIFKCPSVWGPRNQICCICRMGL